MKQILPIALATTVSAELLSQVLNEALDENPHIEQEIVEPAPQASSAVQSSGAGDHGGGGQEPLGRFRWKVFYAEMLKANRKKDRFGMHDAFLTAARTMVRDRELCDWERVMQYDMLKYEMQMLHWRTHGRVNCFGALPAIAAALKIRQPSGQV
jgi:hypothetical protein